MARGLRDRGPLHLSVGLLALLGAVLFLAPTSGAVVRALWAIQEPVLRRNLLTLLATAVALSWVLAQGLMRVPLTWQLDLRPLLPLPVRFRTLYAARLLAGFFGWGWLLFGPGLFFALRAASTTPAAGGIALLATLASITILGRVVALVCLITRSLSRRTLGSLVLLAVFVLVFGSLRTVGGGFEAPPGDGGVALLAERIAGSRLSTALGFLPPGLAAGIFDAPSAVGANLVRLALLWATAATLVLVELRVLEGHYYASSPAGTRGGGGLVPLDRLLRSRRRLAPGAWLTLVEIETVLRVPLLRATFLLCFAFALVHRWTPDDFLAVVAVSALPVAATSQLKSNVLGAFHAHLAESFLLPIHPADHVLARVAALDLLAAAVPLTALTLALAAGGWPGLWLVCLWISLPLTLLLAGDVACGWGDVRWPRPIDYGRLFPTGGNQAGSTLMLVVVVAIAGIFAALFVLGRSLPLGPPLATAGALLLAGGAAAARLRFRRWLRTRIATDRERILDTLAA